MKKIISLFLLLCTTQLVAQNKIIVQGTYPNLVFTHTVQKGETLCSVCRIYDQPLKKLASLNKVTLFNSNGKTIAILSVGQTLKIPVNPKLFKQKANPSAIPMYYTVGAGDNLYHLHLKMNNPGVQTIIDWNKLSSDVLSAGQELIIGYLQLPANLNKVAIAGCSAAEENESKNFVNHRKANSKKANNENHVKDKHTTTVLPPANEEENATELNTDVPPEFTMPPLAIDDSVDSNQNNNDGNNLSNVDHSSTLSSGMDMPSFFSNEFVDNASKKTVVGTASIFIIKSGAGSKDAHDNKFYAMMNNVTPGSVVKITANGKTIYAKVLNKLDDASLTLRVSDVAFGALGINADKFETSVTY